MDLKEIVRQQAIDVLDMDYVGVAGIERFAEAPEGHRPQDILPGAKSVIVMAIKLPQGAVQAIFRSYEEGKRYLQCIYGAHGYSLTPNYHLVFAAYRMARFLEKKGFITVPLPSGPGAGGAPFSHRHAAVAAGLGILGWHGLFMTPEAGPRVRIVSVITKAEMEPDPLYNGPRLCDPQKCQICVKACPTKAIPTDRTKTANIGGMMVKYAEVDLIKCQFATEGIVKRANGLKDISMPENPTMADFQKAREQVDPRQLKEAIIPVDRGSYYCGRCLAYCPVGKKYNMMEHKEVV